MLGLAIFIAAKNTLGSRRVKGALRVLAYGTVVSAGLFVYSYRSAKADIGKSSMQVGRDLAQVADLLQETTQIRLNDQPVYVASAVTQEPLSDVLERFDKHCAASPGALGESWKGLAKAGKSLDPKTDSKAAALVSAGIVHHETRKEGVVLCLVKGSETRGTLTEAARAFTKTHDLGVLGKLRYAYAQVTPQGNTMVLTVWTEDRFNLGAIFPAEGEAPGKDPEGIPRPPDSKRLMSIDIAGTPFGTFVYRSKQEPAQLVGFYDAEMNAKGWTIIDPDQAYGAAQTGRGHAYMKDGAQFLVAVGKDDSGSTILSIGELAARPRSPTP